LNLGCLSTQLDGSLHLAPLGTLATAFYSFAAGISILLTGAISLKLFLHKRQMAKQFIGKRTSDANYVSILGILMESAAFYSGSCLIFVILDVTGNPSSVWFSGVLSAASVSVPVLYDAIQLAQYSLVSVPILDYPTCRSRLLIREAII
jgi:hypothetical protein